MRAALLLLLTSTCFFACDDTEDGGVVIETSVDPTRKLDELSADEREELCEAIQAAPAVLTDPGRVCEAQATVQTDSPEACRRVVTECLTERSAQPDDPDDVEACADARTEEIPCSATVSVYLGCLESVLDAGVSVLNRFSCANASTIGIEEARAIEDETQARVQSALNSGACAAGRMECPELYPTDDDDDVSGSDDVQRETAEMSAREE